jgi:hypothetical protein
MQAEWAAVYCVRSRTGPANGASNNCHWISSGDIEAHA